MAFVSRAVGVCDWRRCRINPDATRNDWQRLGGNSLLFRLQRDGKYALLKAKGNDKSAREMTYENQTMKILLWGAQVEINGQAYFAFYIANFDPLDPQNLDPSDLTNWNFFLSIPTYAGNPVNIQEPTVQWTDAINKKPTIFPLVILYGDEQYQQTHPLLAQLLAIEGNDASKLEYGGSGYAYFRRAIVEAIPQLNPTNTVMETQAYQNPIFPYLQQMLFLVEVGSTQ
ncbi:MAG: hypothetical protein N2049_07820 [Anaerolineales bacterium]|nr:hypothetical protein [Anaerolineales bacterium]